VDTRSGPSTPEPSPPAGLAQIDVPASGALRGGPLGSQTESESDPEDLARVWRTFWINGAGKLTFTDVLEPPKCPATECDSFRTGEARWPSDGGTIVIPFRYSDDGRVPGKASGAGDVVAALNASAAEWNGWNPSVQFRNAGTTDAPFGAQGTDGGCDDDVNVVTWRRFDPGIVGAATLCYDRTDLVIRDADLALNSTHRWRQVTGAAAHRSAYDLQAIFTHELGHWLSLRDLYVASTDEAQTMFGSTQTGETRKRTLALGDVLGSRAAYPCGSSCPTLSGIADD
jgi:hypothetical protein